MWLAAVAFTEGFDGIRPRTSKLSLLFWQGMPVDAAFDRSCRRKVRSTNLKVKALLDIKLNSIRVTEGAKFAISDVHALPAIRDPAQDLVDDRPLLFTTVPARRQRI